MRRLSVPLAALTATLMLASHSYAGFVGRQTDDPAFRQVGVASWYGPGFHGRRTASGERFDQNDLTAAHRNLPQRLTLGSFAHYLVNHAPCAVLVLRPPAEV